MSAAEVSRSQDAVARAEELRSTLEELRVQKEELRAARETILSERQRYQELFNLAPDAYLVTDPGGVIREANLAAGALTGRRVSRLLGKPLDALIAPDDRPHFDELLNRLRAGEAGCQEEFHLARAGGPAVSVSVHVCAAQSPAGQLVGFRWLLHDLTRLQEAQDRLVRSERLAAVGQAVAGLVHEGRGVLQRGVAYLRVLRLEAADNPAVVGRADRVQEAFDALTRLFNDIRSVSTPAVLQRRPCNLADVWRSAWALATQGHRAGTLTEEAAGRDLACDADPFRLEQVFRNLFENALSIGPPAARVTVAAADAGLSGRPAVRVTVRDAGPGLTAEQRLRLFEPFYSTKPDGMGLGLTIVKHLVEAHGGTVAVGDPGPVGTEIVLTIPREAP